MVRNGSGTCSTPPQHAPGSPRAWPSQTAIRPDRPACLSANRTRRIRSPTSPARWELPAACAASTSAAGSRPRAARSDKSRCAATTRHETAHAAENLDEDFLGQVGSIGAVLHGARQQRKNRLMVARDKPRKRFLRAGPQLRDQSRFFGLERQRAGKIAHGEVRLQISSPPTLPQIAVPLGICLRSLEANGARCRWSLLPAVRGITATTGHLGNRMPMHPILLDTGNPPKCSRSRYGFT